MSTTTRYRLAAIGAAALLAGCGDDLPVAPNAQVVADLRGCENLRAPAQAAPSLHLYARGVQIYRWNGTSWAFVEPSAALFTDAAGKETVGIHYAGPTWQSVSGSKVAGTVVERCTPNASAIPWLLLGAVPSGAPGVFQRTAFIQRVNTVGGNAPATPGNAVGDVASVPYTAEYFFYQGP